MTTLPKVGRLPVGDATDPRSGMSVPVTAHVIASEGLAVEVWDHGARVAGVFAPDRHGTVDNVALRYATLAEYSNPGHGYLGATIGRYANRIAGARAPIDGRDVTLDPNEGANQLHGGPVGLDQYVWSVADRTDSSIVCSLVSPDGDQGFPGAVTVTVTYSIDGDTLSIDTTAQSDADTVFSTTNHTYWNLAGTTPGGAVAEHELEVRAPRYVEVDDDLIPTGRLLPTADTRFDFSSMRPLASAVESGGIDHCLVADDGTATARLFHPGSGRLLEVASNQPGIQVYTGQHLAIPYAGMCLEPESLPDTPNRPEFGSAVLRVGETYRHHMTCRLSVASAR